MPVLAKLVRELLAEKPTCERCGGKATCGHHWAGRRSNLVKKEFLRSSCWPCNLFAKEHPKEARAEGWIAPVGVYLC